MQAALQACIAFEAGYPARAVEVASAKAAVMEEREARSKQAERRRMLAREARAGRSTARAPGRAATQDAADRFRRRPPSDAASGMHWTSDG